MTTQKAANAELNSSGQDQTLETYPIYVGGRFVASSRALNVVSPYSNAVMYRTYLAGDHEYNAALKAAEAVRRELQQMPTFQRYQILRQIADNILVQRERFAVIMARESAKPLKSARQEVDRAAQTFLVAAEEAKRLPGEVLSLDWTPTGQNKDAIVKYFPIGLVAGISPFNFPLNLVAHKVAPAIAAGCPLVLKPASKTPITALLLASIVDRTSLPRGALSVLPMDRQIGQRLVTDDRFALLSFTGSPAVGWAMKKDCGKKKVVLELGGNAGVIVDRDADLHRAVLRCVVGAFGNAGQSCIHTQRIYVERSLFADFLAALVADTERLRLGDPEDETTDLSALIDEENALRIESWVEEARASGAKVLFGGVRHGSIYEPTIITQTDSGMKVCQQEAFAPVVVVEPYDRFQDAIEMLDNSPFGLQAGIFTNDFRKIMYAFEHLHVGGVTVNEVPTFRAEHMPYGGVKDSGLGREGPRYAIHDMLEPRALVYDRQPT